MMLAMRFAGIAAFSELSMASSYSSLNCLSDVWYMTLTSVKLGDEEVDERRAMRHGSILLARLGDFLVGIRGDRQLLVDVLRCLLQCCSARR